MDSQATRYWESALKGAEWLSAQQHDDGSFSSADEGVDAYGNVTISDWSGEFENGRLAFSRSITNQINRDGTSSTSDNTVTYTYDANNELTGAHGITNLSGEAEDINRNIIYTYTGTNEQFYEIVDGKLRLNYTISDTEQVKVEKR